MKRRRIAQLGVALLVGSLVWIVALAPERDAGEVLPSTSPDFSLDLEVVDSVDHSVIYAVEQRARPDYRILAFDPATGSVDTVYTVPEKAIIFDISLSPDGETLAVAYSPDFAIEGNGLSLLDLSSGELRDVTPAETDLYITDLSWSVDGDEVLATKVDRIGEGEDLSIVGVSLDGTTREILDTGITPIETDAGLFYLTLDEDKARRAIGFIGADGETHIIEVEDGGADLGHLVTTDDSSQVAVAVIEADDSLLTIGEEASAHGDHAVPSIWFNAEVDGDTESRDELGEKIVYDAAASSANDSIIYATLEGISIATDERVDVIESRAIRMVAG